MLNLLTQTKLTFTPNQYSGLLILHLLCSETFRDAQTDKIGRKRILSVAGTLNLLNRMNINQLVLLMTQTSGRIYEYMMLNSSKKFSAKTQCVLFVNRKHPFLNRQIKVEEREITSPLFLQVLGDYLNEVYMNPTARMELKNLIAKAIS